MATLGTNEFIDGQSSRDPKENLELARFMFDAEYPMRRMIVNLHEAKFIGYELLKQMEKDAERLAGQAADQYWYDRELQELNLARSADEDELADFKRTENYKKAREVVLDRTIRALSGEEELYAAGMKVSFNKNESVMLFGIGTLVKYSPTEIFGLRNELYQLLGTKPPTNGNFKYKKSDYQNYYYADRDMAEYEAQVISPVNFNGLAVEEERRKIGAISNPDESSQLLEFTIRIRALEEAELGPTINLSRDVA